MGQSNNSGLTNTANQLSAEQAQLFNQVLGSLGNMQAATGPLMQMFPQLGTLMTEMLQGGGQQLPGMFQQLMSLSGSPQALAQFTGVNAPGMMQSATNYLSHPGSTNLAELFPQAMHQMQPGQSAFNLAGPQAMNFYRNEMQNGINPQYAQNAQNQLQQQFGTALNTSLAHAGPGQNTNAMSLAAQDQLLGASTNLGGQLAGMGQQFANQGAQGLASTGQALDQNTLQRLAEQWSMSSGLDAQKQQMLTGAAQLGTEYNQQMLGNVGGGLNAGMGVMSGAQGLGQIGLGASEFGANTMQQMGTTLGNQAFDYTQLATQLAAAQPNVFSLLAQLGGSGASAYGNIASGKGAGAAAAPAAAGKAAAAA